MLRHDCDQAKIALTQQDMTTITCRHEGKSVTVPVTRDQFEELTADLLQRTFDTAQLVVEQAGVKPEELDAIVLVGGSTLMPKVPQVLKELSGKEPFQGLSPHTAVAQGAAIHAAILEAKFRGESPSRPTASANCWAASSKRTSTRTAWALRPAIPRPEKRSTT